MARGLVFGHLDQLEALISILHLIYLWQFAIFFYIFKYVGWNGIYFYNPTLTSNSTF